MAGHVDGEARRHRTGDLTKTLGVSRTSLVYYEQMGLVTPRRDPKTGVREYSDGDVFDLVGYAALSNLGLSAKEVAAAAATRGGLFDEDELEGYLDLTSEKIAYYSVLREAIDRMRVVRVRRRSGPEIAVERVERHIFVEDGAEGGYMSFESSDDLDRLIEGVPISGFGILFGFSGEGQIIWRWGRTVPTRFAPVVGFEHHCPTQVGGCDCVTRVTCVVDGPPSADLFDGLYSKARQLGRKPAEDPFVPYIFPPHSGTPFKVCLPLEG